MKYKHKYILGTYTTRILLKLIIWTNIYILVCIMHNKKVKMYNQVFGLDLFDKRIHANREKGK
jgi:hypothetical protein